jgi:hypothetical protein
VRQAHFCLHTEGNGWGARVVDYMAMECLPLMLNDEALPLTRTPDPNPNPNPNPSPNPNPTKP